MIKPSNQWNEPRCLQSKCLDICFKDVFEKFHQNPDLLNMLRSTSPLTIAEALNDHIWGTGILLRDANALS